MTTPPGKDGKVTANTLVAAKRSWSNKSIIKPVEHRQLQRWHLEQSLFQK